MKGDDGTQRICVRPPNISVPAPPPSYKAYKDSSGGDIVILPSGMVIRVKDTPEADGRRPSHEDARSGCKENASKIPSKKSEESKRGGMGNSRKRKLSIKDKMNEERESKMSSFEVLQPTNATISKAGYIPGMPWATPHHNYPALVQQLYHQIYQMQQQLQVQSHQGNSYSMPPPPPPLGQTAGESYPPPSGPYVSFHQIPLGKGKDRATMLVPGLVSNPMIRPSSHAKQPVGSTGIGKVKRSAGMGRGRRAKNGDGRSMKKVCYSLRKQSSLINFGHSIFVTEYCLTKMFYSTTACLRG